MISARELVKNNDKPDEDSQINLLELHYSLNFARRLTDFPWVITRGFSTPEEQRQIYAEKNQAPKMGSCHLIGAAADIADPDRKLQKWILDHLEIIEDLHIFLESFEATPTWVHWQIFPYGSWEIGKTHFFEP